MGGAKKSVSVVLYLYVILTSAKEKLWLAPLTLAHEYLATSTRPLVFTAPKTFLDMVTCKIKHLQNICKNVLEPREVDGSKTFFQMFFVGLLVTTVYLQVMFDRAKMFCNIFANVLA